MKILAPLTICVALFVLTACSSPGNKTGENQTGFSTPEAMGISSRAILGFVDALEKEQPDALHSFILRRHGNIVARGWWAPYQPESPHMLYSLSKSFTSTAIGIAQDEGLLSIDDPVISFFPDDLPENPSDNLKAMRIRDLLKMNSGHQDNTSGRMMSGETNVKGFLALEVEHKPGTHFVYNSGASYMLSAIIQKVTGKTVLEYLEPRLFEPLGIENPTWESDAEGINFGGWGLSVTTKDISSLGQLYLQKGKWKGEQLISEAWVEEATKLQTSNGSNPESDWEQGYGYQFWMCRHGIFRGDGAFGQYCIVMPEQDAVLAITSGTGDMQGILNVAWDHLLPAMEDAPLPPNKAAADSLDQRLQGLGISLAEGSDKADLTSAISGKSYEINPNGLAILGVSFDFETTPNLVTIKINEGDKPFSVGYGNWENGEMKIPSWPSDLMAASGAWVSPDTYAVKLVYYETPYNVMFRFRFDGNSLYWDTELNASFSSTKLEQLTGSSGS
ncbi:MAG: serine hydrolase [Bacteroidota bacterium]